MPDLPIYPQKREAPGYALERRLNRIKESGSETYANAVKSLRARCVTETLRLTGGREESDLFRGQFAALELIERAAGKASEPHLDLIREVHCAANPGADGSFRTEDAPAQFKNARASPPRFIQAKLENLLQWLSAESGREMFPAARMALWFARFVEIAPFARGNFRTAHLMANFFAAAAGFPPVALLLDDADAIRAEVDRAIQFDTAPLVERFTQALDTSLRTCEEATAREAE